MYYTYSKNCKNFLFDHVNASTNVVIHNTSLIQSNIEYPPLNSEICRLFSDSQCEVLSSTKCIGTRY